MSVKTLPLSFLSGWRSWLGVYVRSLSRLTRKNNKVLLTILDHYLKQWLVEFDFDQDNPTSLRNSIILIVLFSEFMWLFGGEMV